MFCKSVKVRLVLAVAFSTALISGSVWAESSRALEREENTNAAAFSFDLQRKEEKIDQITGKLVAVGTELDESQRRVDQARKRQKELGQRAQTLTEELDAQKEATARSRSRLEDQIRVSYKGRDLEGILLLLEGLFGLKDAQNSALTRQTTLLLTNNNEDIQYHKNMKQKLGVTLRQLEQSKGEYRASRQEDQALVEDLAERELELRAAIESLGFRRDLMQEKLAELETAEEAGLLKRPPATDKKDEPVKTRDRKDFRDEMQDRSGKQDREGEERDVREVEKDGRNRELEIAREDVATRPVRPIPYEDYVRLYRESAERYGFGGDWYVLAAVGKIESNHGENMGPSGAGAMGPMQFLPSTWSSYGVDGDGDGEANIMDPEDAIPAAAAYLKAGGAPDDWYAALFTYNRAGWYVEEALAIAETYRRIHGDTDVGPYLTPAPNPPKEIPSRFETLPTGPDEVPEEGWESPTVERPSDEATPPSDREPQPTDDALDKVGETTSEPADPSEKREVTAGQYQY